MISVGVHHAAGTHSDVGMCGTNGRKAGIGDFESECDFDCGGTASNQRVYGKPAFILGLRIDHGYDPHLLQGGNQVRVFHYRLLS